MQESLLSERVSLVRGFSSQVTGSMRHSLFTVHCSLFTVHCSLLTVVYFRACGVAKRMYFATVVASSDCAVAAVLLCKTALCSYTADTWRRGVSNFIALSTTSVSTASQNNVVKQTAGVVSGDRLLSGSCRFEQLSTATGMRPITCSRPQTTPRCITRGVGT